MPEIKVYDDYQAMAFDCELVDLVIYEIRAVRNGAGIDGDPEEEPVDDELDLEAQVFARLMESQTVFEVRQRIHVTGNGARFTVDAGAIFEFPQESRFEKQAQEAFLSRVGLMVLHPHVREALHTLSSKLGVEPVLLPLRRNFDLEPMGPDEADLDLQLSNTDELGS